MTDADEVPNPRYVNANPYGGVALSNPPRMITGPRSTPTQTRAWALKQLGRLQPPLFCLLELLLILVQKSARSEQNLPRHAFMQYTSSQNPYAECPMQNYLAPR